MGTFLAEAKVYQFDLQVLIEQYVISFQVAMSYPFLMEIGNRYNHMSENIPGLIFV